MERSRRPKDSEAQGDGMTVADLFSLAMMSDTAYRHMADICKELGLVFPPEVTDTNLIFSTDTKELLA